MKTIDKIKHIIGSGLFNHWTTVKNIEFEKNARNLLAREIESGLLTDIKHITELELLNYLTEYKNNN